MLSDEEHNLIQFYLKKYKITNRSRWYRETVLNHILKTWNRTTPPCLKKTKCDDNELSYHHTAQLKNMLDDNYFMRQALLEAQKAFNRMRCRWVPW